MGSQGFLCVHGACVEVSCLESGEGEPLLGNSDFAVANLGAKTLLIEAVNYHYLGGVRYVAR